MKTADYSMIEASWQDSQMYLHLRDDRSDSSKDKLRAIYHRCLNRLVEIGFAIGTDPVVVRRGYKTMFKDRHAGSQRQCQFNSEINPVMGCIEFFQDVVIENPNGGRYDFNKLSKMPFLIRMQFLRAKRALQSLIESIGIVDTTEPDHVGVEYIKHRILTCGHFRGGNPLVDWFPTSDYNNRDANERIIHPGERKCGWGYKGHLIKGVVYYNLNNMWWMLAGKSVFNIAGFNLFDWKPGLPRRREWTVRQKNKKWMAELDCAAKQHDFERAIVLRDLIKQSALTA